MNNLGNTIPTDFVIRYLFDGDGLSNPVGSNATVTNPVWVKSGVGYQLQCLSWGASTTCTYSSVTYTNSYIWIYASGVWIFTKNSAKVSATALSGVSGEYYAMLTFFNRTLTENEEQLLKLEGLRKLGPSNIASYPNLLSGLAGYWDMKGDVSNIVNGVLATNTGVTAGTDRIGNSGILNTYTNSFINTNANIIPTAHTIFSYNVWAKANTTGVARNLGGNFVSDGYYFQITATNLLFADCYGDGGNYYRAISTGTFTDTTNYHMYTLVKDGARSFKIYVDSVEISTNKTDTASNNFYTTGNRCIGSLGLAEGTSNCWKGQLEMPLICNKTFTADEVKLLYNLTSKDYIYPAPSYDIASLRDGLVLDLNEQGKDLSGNGNDGTLVNGPTVVRQGKAKGLSYNGSNQYIEISAGIPIPTNTTIFTKIKLNDISGIKSIFMDNGGVLQYWGCWVDGQKITFAIGNGSNNYRYYTTNDNILTSGLYYSIGITQEGLNNAKIYINGILVPSTIAQGGAGEKPTTNGNSNIGRYYNIAPPPSPVWYFNGQIYIFKIYNRILSAKEIQALYYSEKGNFIY